ncbi:MAG: helix-turn-helix transcriptional regulator [Thermocrispum sp.]
MSIAHHAPASYVGAVTTGAQAVERRARLRAELRGFLRAKRARLSPEDVGMPAGGRRRTPGLRREEVAVLAGVGVSWYTWLEQGRDINASESVLDAICSALRLDEQERAHLYRLAGLNPPAPAAPAAADGVAPSPALRRLIDGWLPNPAYLIDRYWNIRLLNRAAGAVLGLTDADRNCVLSFFTDTVYRARHERWHELAPAIVSEFRRDSARYPDDHGFDALIDRLLRVSTDFADLWHRHDVRSNPEPVKVIQHPVAGTLEFEPNLLQLPAQPHLRLIVHVPRPGTTTARRVDDLLHQRVDLASAG